MNEFVILSAGTSGWQLESWDSVRNNCNISTLDGILCSSRIAREGDRIAKRARCHGGAERSMKIRQAIGCVAAPVIVFGITFVLAAQTASPLYTAKSLADATVADPATERALLNQYCVICHNQKLRTAGSGAGQTGYGARRRSRRKVGAGGAKAAVRHDAALRDAEARLDYLRIDGRMAGRRVG